MIRSFLRIILLAVSCIVHTYSYWLWRVLMYFWYQHWGSSMRLMSTPHPQIKSVACSIRLPRCSQFSSQLRLCSFLFHVSSLRQEIFVSGKQQLLQHSGLQTSNSSQVFGFRCFLPLDHSLPKTGLVHYEMVPEDKTFFLRCHPPPLLCSFRPRFFADLFSSILSNFVKVHHLTQSFALLHFKVEVVSVIKKISEDCGECFITSPNE